MSKKIIQLSIPKPCSEGWNNMLPEEKGKFCLTCQKSVIDFAQMTDREIVKAIEKHKGELCGHFSTKQLERNITIDSTPKLPFVQVSKAAAVVLPLFFVPQYSAQTVQKVAVSQMEQEEVKQENKDTFVENVFVDFLITDAQVGEPIPFVQVYLDGQLAKTLSDFDGHVKIELNDSVKTLRFVNVGYYEYILQVTNEVLKSKLIHVQLESHEQVIDGMVIVMDIENERPKWWQFRKRIQYGRMHKN